MLLVPKTRKSAAWLPTNWTKSGSFTIPSTNFWYEICLGWERSNPLSMCSLGKPNLRCVSDSPSVDFLATHVVDVGHRHLCQCLWPLHKREESAWLPPYVPYREEAQPADNERKDASGTHLSPTLQGQCANFCLYFWTIFLQLESEPENVDAPVSPNKGPPSRHLTANQKTCG